MRPNQEDEKGQAHSMYGKVHHKRGYKCKKGSTAIALLFL
jgi:hypothetical protein